MRSYSRPRYCESGASFDGAGGLAPSPRKKKKRKKERKKEKREKKKKRG